MRLSWNEVRWLKTLKYQVKKVYLSSGWDILGISVQTSQRWSGEKWKVSNFLLWVLNSALHRAWWRLMALCRGQLAGQFGVLVHVDGFAFFSLGREDN